MIAIVTIPDKYHPVMRDIAERQMSEIARDMHMAGIMQLIIPDAIVGKGIRLILDGEVAQVLDEAEGDGRR